MTRTNDVEVRESLLVQSVDDEEMMLAYVKRVGTKRHVVLGGYTITASAWEILRQGLDAMLQGPRLVSEE